MPRPRSPQTQAALDDIKAGMSQSEASRKHGVDQGLLSRMLKPKEREVSVKLSAHEIRCVLDGIDHYYAEKKLSDALAKLTGTHNT